MKKDLIDEVVQLGLDRAKCRRTCPVVIKALLDLEWTETRLAEYLGLTSGAVSSWVTGQNRIPSKRYPVLYQLLEDTVRQYEQEIGKLRENGEWSESAAYRMRYKLSNARGVLTRYKNRQKDRDRREINTPRKIKLRSAVRAAA